MNNLKKIIELFTLVERREDLFDRFFDSSNIFPIGTMFILVLYSFIVNHFLYKYNNLIPLIVGCIFCIIAIFYKEDIEDEKYFEDDETIYKKIQLSNHYMSKFSISVFSIILNLILPLGLNLVKSYLNSYLVVAFVAITVLLSSVFITDWIRSYLYNYDFTINYVFYSSLNQEQKLWTYLKYREEVINCIRDNKPIFTRKYISDENKKEVTFEEFEQVNKVIENLKTKQLEKILFKYNSSSFNKQALKNWGKKWGGFVTLSSLIGSVFLFFREDIRIFILEQLQYIPTLITKMNDSADKFISFLRVQGNGSSELCPFIVIPQEIYTISLLERVLFYLCISYLLIFLLFVSKEKLARYFNHPRKMTIEKYLIPMIENELKKKRLQEKKIQIYRMK